MNNYKLISVMISLLCLFGCNTMAGLGEDIQIAGEAISTSAGEVKEKITK